MQDTQADTLDITYIYIYAGLPPVYLFIILYGQQLDIMMWFARLLQ